MTNRSPRPPKPEDRTGASTSGRERLHRMRCDDARSAARRRRGLVAAGLATVIAVGGVGAYVATRGDDAAGSGSTPSSTSGSIAGLKTWSGLGRTHVEGDPTFAMTPPVGGNHNQAWANCGTYDTTVPDKYAVHSLEHGAVWITYTSKVSSADLATLKKLANQDYMLMSPYPTQKTPIVVSAWEHQITATSASDPRIEQFVRAYLQGPQTPEPGAPCSGGYDPTTGTIAGSM